MNYRKILLSTAILAFSFHHAQNLKLNPTSAEERWKGYEQRKKLEENSILKNLEFRNVGPTTMSGRVTDIDANPENPTEFYVAYASGGLWYTNNNGTTFTPIFDREAVMTIGDIYIDWKTKTIFIGTGESNSSRSSYAGMGIYKSTDQGKTWQNLGLKDTHHIGRIVVNPENNNEIWVAAVGHLYSPNAERGVFKTNDGGKTWKKTLSADQNSGAIDLAINPQNPKEVYATLWYKERKAWKFVESGASSGIFKSNDGGESWQKISTKDSGFPADENVGRIGLSIFPKNPNIIYAIVDNQKTRPASTTKEEKSEKSLDKAKMQKITKEEFLALDDKTVNEYLDGERFPERYTSENLKKSLRENKITVKDIFNYTHNGNDDLFNIEIEGAEVYRSDDAGKSWRKTNEKNLDGLYYTYGYYFGQIWVSPTNPDKVIIAGVPILVSENGGKSFKSIDSPNVHADHHSIWFNPKNDNHFINGNDGGINISYDNGNSYIHCNSLPVSQFYSVDYDLEKPYNVYGGMQDNGVWFGPSSNKFDYKKGKFDNGDNFKFLLGGDGMQVRVDFRDNATIYTGFQFGNYFRINRKTNERKYLEVPREIGENPLRFNWEAPFQISRHNQDIVYFASQSVYRSMDKGETWQKISGDLTRNTKQENVPYSTLSTVEESPKKFGLIYAGSDDGLVNVTKDGGNSWQKIGDFPGFWVSMVQPSSFSESRVYLSLNAYREDDFRALLYSSDDFGKTWKKIGEDLPSEPINVIREDHTNENLLYVGTDNGLYISLDRGKTFMSANNATLPNVAVHDLKVHHRDNELIVATHGRSIYIADVKKLQKLTPENLAKDLIVFDVESINFKENWGKSYSNFTEIEKQNFPIEFYTKNAGNAVLKIINAQNETVKTINHLADKGFNTINYDLTVNATEKSKKADDGNVYITPGKYTVEISINGVTEKKSLEVKERPKSKSKRVTEVPQGTMSPGEFKKWRKEVGFKKQL